MVKDLVDPRRTEPPQDRLADREMLEAWLEFHRTTLLLKCEGLDDAQRKARPVPTSDCPCTAWSGTWPRSSDLVQPGAVAGPQRRYLVGPDVEASELLPLDDADWAADLAAWQAECADEPGRGRRPRPRRHRPHRDG